MDGFDFRQLCGRFATGIAVVTARDGEGEPAGMTVSSFASVSLEPPLVAIAVDRTATMHAVLLTAGHYTINILEARQESLSRRFASDQPDRFEGVGFAPGDTDRIVLDGTLAHLACERFAAFPAGDHTIVVGRVVGGAAAEHGRPLLHYRGGYAVPGSG